MNLTFNPVKSVFKTVLITPANASAPYIAEAPSLKISTLSAPLTGIAFELVVITGILPPNIGSV